MSSSIYDSLTFPGDQAGIHYFLRESTGRATSSLRPHYQVLTVLLKRKAHIVGPFTLAGRWLTGLLSGYRGDEMLRRGYEKVMLLLLRERCLGLPMYRPKLLEACLPCRLWAGILSL